MKKSEKLRETILDTSIDLFLEKGYDRTTISDIIEQVGGLSRGGFYHHFSSKEAILLEVSSHLKKTDQVYYQLLSDQHFSGLEKIKKILLHNFSQIINNPQEQTLIALLNEPRFLDLRIQELEEDVFVLYEKLIVEGVEDGSIQIDHPKMVAQMVAVLLNIWCQPTIFKCSNKELIERYELVKRQLEALNLPIFDDEVWASLKKYLEQLKV